MDAHQKVRFGLVFDDGFRASSVRTAGMFEELGLRATFAVVSDPKAFVKNREMGDWGLWRELVARGHRVQPHGDRHLKLWELSEGEAKAEVDRCMEAFGREMPGFEASKVVYHYAFNTGTEAMDRHLLGKWGVRAVRGKGDGFLDEKAIASKLWHSRTFGPGDPGEDLLEHLCQCREVRPAAFIYSLHGLDGEAWGAIDSRTLRKVVETLKEDPVLEFWGI